MKASSHDDLIKTLAARFSKNMQRHAGTDRESVQAKLTASSAVLLIIGFSLDYKKRQLLLN